MFVNDCSFMPQGLGQGGVRSERRGMAGMLRAPLISWNEILAWKLVWVTAGLSPEAPQPPAGRRQSPAGYRGAFALIEDSNARSDTSFLFCWNVPSPRYFVAGSPAVEGARQLLQAHPDVGGDQIEAVGPVSVSNMLEFGVGAGEVKEIDTPYP
jgi:hypothetical protein